MNRCATRVFLRGFRRGGVYYSEDTFTGKQLSLRTKNKAEAITHTLKQWTAGRDARKLKIIPTVEDFEKASLCFSGKIKVT